MKITVERDGETTVFQNVTDALLVVRSLDPMASREGEPVVLMGTRSYSWSGGGLREIVKETEQAAKELQATLDLLRADQRT